jgi:hypothetical protein
MYDIPIADKFYHYPLSIEYLSPTELALHMTWQEQYQHLRQALTAVHETSEAEAMAALVVEHVGKKKINQLKQEEVGSEEAAQIEQILQQLLTHRPLQCIE